MLQVTIRTEAIEAHAEARGASGLNKDAWLAGSIMLRRRAFEAGAKRFAKYQRQAQQKDWPMLHDGRIDTLRRDLFGPLAELGWPGKWPTPAASILHGLRLDDAVPLQALGAVGAGGADPYSYLAKLYDGPPQARKAGDMAALTLYFDPLNRLEIVWIDREAAFSSGMAHVGSSTNGFTDWTRFSPDYARWLQGNG